MVMKQLTESLVISALSIDKQNYYWNVINLSGDCLQILGVFLQKDL